MQSKPTLQFTTAGQLAPIRQPKPTVRAAGAVVFDQLGRVAIVHRPDYPDLSLPKGKAERDECAAATAVREVREETGAEVILESELPSVGYRVARGDKLVRWFRARLLEQRPRQPDSEVDEVCWLDPELARLELTYPSDRETLAAALEAPGGPALIMLRHATARTRKSWRAGDLQRPLSAAGERQAVALVDTLRGFGVQTLISSPALRCTATLRPYAQLTGLPIIEREELSEPAGERDPAAAGRVVTAAAAEACRTGRPVVICGHRPVLPVMLDAAGLAQVALRPGEYSTRGLGASLMAVRP